MYRRAKFVEVLLEIRQEMALEADYDVDLFVEMARSGGAVVSPGDRKNLVDPRIISAVEAEPDPIRLDKDIVGK
ncbi:MAG: hypothetical protein ABJA02_00485 [Acidobacteriota bacterium]